MLELTTNQHVTNGMVITKVVSAGDKGVMKNCLRVSSDSLDVSRIFLVFVTAL